MIVIYLLTESPVQDSSEDGVGCFNRKCFIHWLLIAGVGMCHSVMSNSANCSPPGSSVCGIFQAKMLEWVAVPSPGVVA